MLTLLSKHARNKEELMLFQFRQNGAAGSCAVLTSFCYVHVTALYNSPEQQIFLECASETVADVGTVLQWRRDRMLSNVGVATELSAEPSWEYRQLYFRVLRPRSRLEVTGVTVLDMTALKAQVKAKEKYDAEVRAALKAKKMMEAEKTRGPVKRRVDGKRAKPKKKPKAAESTSSSESSDHHAKTNSSESEPVISDVESLWDKAEKKEIKAPEPVKKANGLPTLGKNNKVTDVDGTHLGQLYWLTDACGGKSIALTCALHGCKRRTTINKNPSEARALRWLQMGREPPFNSLVRHTAAYDVIVIPGKCMPGDITKLSSEKQCCPCDIVFSDDNFVMCARGTWPTSGNKFNVLNATLSFSTQFL